MSCSARKRMPSYRLWGSTEDGKIEFESLTVEKIDDALRVLRESFFKNETVCRSVDILKEPGACKELEDLCFEAAKDGVSVVATDISTGKVVGVSFNKIQVRTEPDEKTWFQKFAENCKYDSSKCLVDFMQRMDAQINIFKHYNVDCLLEVMFLATAPDYRGRRIGELLVSSSLEIGRELRCGKNVKTPFGTNRHIENATAMPVLASAIMTSRFSQRIAFKLGFDRLAEMRHDQFSFRGKTFIERIGDDHPTSVLVAKRL